MIYEVKLKQGHPTGSYNRGGLTFTRTAVTKLEDPAPRLLKLIKADPWLIVTEVKPDTDAAAKIVGAIHDLPRTGGRPTVANNKFDGPKSAGGNQGGGAGAAS